VEAFKEASEFLKLLLTFCFSFHIASEWFLSKLLAYRRDIGALSTSAKGALVSEIDVIIATIAEASVCISGGTSHVDSMGDTLARHKEDEAIRAASQLPCRSSIARVRHIRF
jgi:hypothetical protein